MLLEHAAQPVGALDVQTVGRLVQNEELRPPRHGGGQVDPLALARGQVLDPATHQRIEIELVDDAVHLVA